MHLKLSLLTACWLLGIENRSWKELLLYTLATRGRWNYLRSFFILHQLICFATKSSKPFWLRNCNSVWKSGQTAPARSSPSTAALLLHSRKHSRHPRTPAGLRSTGPGRCPEEAVREGVRAGSHGGPRPSRPSAAPRGAWPAPPAGSGAPCPPRGSEAAGPWPSRAPGCAAAAPCCSSSPASSLPSSGSPEPAPPSAPLRRVRRSAGVPLGPGAAARLWAEGGALRSLRGAEGRGAARCLSELRSGRLTARCGRGTGWGVRGSARGRETKLGGAKSMFLQGIIDREIFLSALWARC